MIVLFPPYRFVHLLCFYYRFKEIKKYEFLLVSYGVLTWVSSVGVATSYKLDGQGSICGGGGGQDFSLLHSVQTGSGVQPASFPICTRGLSKRDSKLIVHLHVGAKVKNGGSVSPLPHMSS
jgi:hypothetical protein